MHGKIVMPDVQSEIYDYNQVTCTIDTANAVFHNHEHKIVLVL